MNQCNKFGRKLRILSLCFILLAAVTVFAVTPFAFAEDQTVSDEAAAEEGSAGILEEEPFIPPASFTNVAPFGDPVQGTAPAYAVQAANDGAETDDGMVLSKTATANDDGSYTIQMEAYATGSKIISEVSKDVPTDIVLVLDQSGSMAYEFGDALGDSHNADTTKGSIEGYYVYKQVSSDWVSSTNYYPVQYNNGTWQYHYQDGWGISRWRNIGNNWNNVYISRLGALKDAVTSFSNAVADKAKGADKNSPDDDMDHRIAIVGFASDSSNLTQGFKNMNDSSQIEEVNAVINNLTANGGTLIDEGLSTAKSVFDANPIQSGQNRNRVVIVFTDGAPGLYGDWASSSIETANSAISKAKTLKASNESGGYGATVYTIGVFSGADASTPNSLPKFVQGNEGSSPLADAQRGNTNRFMHLVSSNYPDATNMRTSGDINPKLNNKSYYLSAADGDALNDIFQKVASEIEEGGTSSTLTSGSVVKDVISPYFTLPKGASANDITLETYACTGKDDSGYTWSKNSDAMGAKATVSGDQVSVTGFNFSENYVGTVTENGNISYRGHKLVISFKVLPKQGFLGGNNVPTNANAGIYAKADDANAVKTFEVPTVNVPIPDITVTAAEKNVYLLQDPTDEQLKAGMTVKCGNVDITDPSRLANWQKEFVTIDTLSVSKSTDFNATDDGTYTITASVSPNAIVEGGATAKTGTGTAKINVFKPEVTFKDSQIYLGQTVADYRANLVGVQWKHENAIADSANMGGANAPELTYSYDPTPNGFKKDTGVKVTGVTINSISVEDYVAFNRQDCGILGGNCQFGKGDFTDCNFIVHVKGFELTIRKEGAQPIDENQSFIFKVEKQNDDGTWSLVTQAVVLGNRYVTITELPIGTYRVVEDQNWSWRYTLTGIEGDGQLIPGVSSFPDQVTFTGEDNEFSKTLTFTNERTQTKWLNGSAFCQNYWTKGEDGKWKVEQRTFLNQTDKQRN